jgi:hypothetical protein
MIPDRIPVRGRINTHTEIEPVPHGYDVLIEVRLLARQFDDGTEMSAEGAMQHAWAALGHLLEEDGYDLIALWREWPDFEDPEEV